MTTYDTSELMLRRKTNISDLAKEAGVSQSTVAQAIHRRRTGPKVEKVWTVLEEKLA